ncbi:hypothetical protein NPIL_498891 [Nephila pilipes]|uniref:Uncharacterized protein n=1 Tax=Nephila pilipes TaxID=299642 RepID=A0A8X6PBX5_NEPPI|nr:hypothetical protein NPIL_498891 [Nephila pilipes]
MPKLDSSFSDNDVPPHHFHLGQGIYAAVTYLQAPCKFIYDNIQEMKTIDFTQLKKVRYSSSTLKIVKVEGKDGEVVNAHYTTPHYVPAIRHSLSILNNSVVTFKARSSLNHHLKGRLIG